MRRSSLALLLALTACGSPAAQGIPSGTAATTTTTTPPAAAPALVAGQPVADPPARPRSPRTPDPATVAADAATARQMRLLLAGCRVRGWTLCAAYGGHYLDGTGTPVVLDVSALLAALPSLRALVATAPHAWTSYACPEGTDAAYALGHVAVRVVGRTVEVADVYDFDPGTPFAAYRSLADHGRAAEFLVTGVAPVPSAP